MTNTSTRSALLRRMLDTRIKVVGVHEAIRELDEAVDLLKAQCACTDTLVQRDELARAEGYEEGHEVGGAEARADAEKDTDKAREEGYEAGLRDGAVSAAIGAWA